MRHQWLEDVGNCVCCWSVCADCRRCKCQAGRRECAGRAVLDTHGGQQK